MASPRINLFRGGMLMMLALGLALWSKPVTADDAAPTYKAKCSACHGADGKGETAMGKKLGLRDLASPEVQKMSDDELNSHHCRRQGQDAELQEELKPEQIKELVGYIRSLAKK